MRIAPLSHWDPPPKGSRSAGSPLAKLFCSLVVRNFVYVSGTYVNCTIIVADVDNELRFAFAKFLSSCRGVCRRGAMYMIRDPQDPSFSPVSGVISTNNADQLTPSSVAAVILGPRHSRQIYIFTAAETDDQRNDVHCRLGRTCGGIALGGPMFAQFDETITSKVVLQVSLGYGTGISEGGILTANPVVRLWQRGPIHGPRRFYCNAILHAVLLATTSPRWSGTAVAS